ncbi:MAG: hypothetical protein HC862_26580 [Scytonema sp. RU_4_4]|nr:hypothetical protein [Scytonema sp. RU_4_4]NJR73159.1 hypothetical protein [Scytonema sp. CRU_2_7]
MSLTTSACCAVTLSQQQEQNNQYHKTQCDEMQCVDTPVDNCKSTSKNCTVVENGRVVVKPAQTRLDKDC